MSRLTNDIDMVANTLGPGVCRFIDAIFTLVGPVAFMVWISWRMTVVACVARRLLVVGRLSACRASSSANARRPSASSTAVAEEMITGQRAAGLLPPTADRGGVQRSVAFAASASGRTLGGLMGPR